VKLVAADEGPAVDRKVLNGQIDSVRVSRICSRRWLSLFVSSDPTQADLLATGPLADGSHGLDAIAGRGRTIMHAAARSRLPPSASNHRRICLVTETYPPEINGVSLTLAHLVKGLLALGHAVSLVRPLQRSIDYTDRNHDCETTLVRGLPLPGYHGLQFGLPAGGLLRRSWTQRRPDVVYVATEGPLGWTAVRTARCLAIPAFSGFHTNYHIYSRHYRVGWLQQLAFRYLRTFHNQTAGTFVPSADLRDRLDNCGFKNVSVLGRGVDNRLFAPERRCCELRGYWGVSEDELAVLYVGRLAPEKNVGLAIDAYRAMKRCSASLKFVIVGDGPLRTALEKEHRDVIFSGLQTGAELARHYASADLFLFPSETETFGNVTLEAMASGLVVVAYNYAAAKIHISHGQTGVLVPYGDSQAFVSSAAGLVHERQHLQRIRRQARDYATSIEWQRVVERFEALLTGACRQSHPDRASSITRGNLAAWSEEGGC
jgi:glycosyltransferase involved in cell wall biosynthesis